MLFKYIDNKLPWMCHTPCGRWVTPYCSDPFLLVSTFHFAHLHKVAKVHNSLRLRSVDRWILCPPKNRLPIPVKVLYVFCGLCWLCTLVKTHSVNGMRPESARWAAYKVSTEAHSLEGTLESISKPRASYLYISQVRLTWELNMALLNVWFNRGFNERIQSWIERSNVWWIDECL